MKELSIEEKAKRYDELKVTAQGLEHDGCFDKITLFDLFPELEESEDERIRKAMIDFFKHEREEGIVVLHYGVNIESMIAWLEKQGEQKIQRCGVSGFTDIVQAIRTVYNEESAYDLVEYLTDLVSKKEQKSVLSEEDIMRIDNLIAIIENRGYPDYVEYLEKLKDRVQPQPKREWSKEDKVILDEIIDFFENGTVKLQHDLSLYASWLKSLKGRVGCEVNCTTMWKPSDEQMKALKEACDEHWEPDGLDPLYTLYQDLKKLREE